MDEYGDWPIQVHLERPLRRHRQKYRGQPAVQRESILESDVGDCYRAAVASLFAMDDLDDVPHFQHIRNLTAREQPHRRLDWYDRQLSREWARQRLDLDLASVTIDQIVDMDCYYIATVPTHRAGGDWHHVVIGKGREIVFDPAGYDDYSFDRDVDVDEPVEVIVDPYDPDPARMLEIWHERSPEEETTS